METSTFKTVILAATKAYFQTLPKDESSDNYFECCGGGAGCPVMVAYESIWRYI